MTESAPESTLLDRILTEARLSNHDLVEVSGGKLSHKNVQKARTGSRPVTDRVARSVTEAVNVLLQPEELWSPRKLFPGDPRGKASVAPGQNPSDEEGDEE